jgi:hypothetical protein
VYGPPSKRARTGDAVIAMDVESALSPTTETPQQASTDSEEPASVSPPTIPAKRTVMTVLDDEDEEAETLHSPVPVTQDDDDTIGLSWEDADAIAFDLDENELFKSYLFDSIVEHKYEGGILYLEVLWRSNEKEFIASDLTKPDFHLCVVRYISEHQVGSKRYNRIATSRWARNMLRNKEKVNRRLLLEEPVVRYPFIFEAAISSIPSQESSTCVTRRVSSTAIYSEHWY